MDSLCQVIHMIRIIWVYCCF